MSQWKCNSCLATYSDLQADGSVYCHACAPLPPNAQGLQVEHANKRDENLTLDGRGRASGIRSAGAGVTQVGGAPVPQPASTPPPMPIGL